MSKQHSFKVHRSAHYYTVGDLSPSTEYIWLACHGYGQAADRFIQKFTSLDLRRHHIVAPEGLSRFYWGGVSGDVVSSWMTRKDRLDEIEDHTSFLEEVRRRVQARAPARAKWILFGFSQGTATVLRYMERFLPAYAHLVIWAGIFPRDVDYGRHPDYWSQGSLHSIYGDQDEYITPKRLKEERAFIAQQGLKVSVLPFAGPHRVDREILQQWAAQL